MLTKNQQYFYTEFKNVSKKVDHFRAKYKAFKLLEIYRFIKVFT